MQLPAKGVLAPAVEQRLTIEVQNKKTVMHRMRDGWII